MGLSVDWTVVKFGCLIFGTVSGQLVGEDDDNRRLMFIIMDMLTDEYNNGWLRILFD